MKVPKFITFYTWEKYKYESYKLNSHNKSYTVCDLNILWEASQHNIIPPSYSSTAVIYPGQISNLERKKQRIN
jgi:hypothetical protein